MAIQQKTLDNALVEARTELLKVAEDLKNFIFPDAETLVFHTENIDVDSIARKISVGSAEEDFIYFFKVLGENKNNRVFVNALKAAKKAQSGERKDLPRVNDTNAGSQYLYVGRSHKLRSRIRQHLGCGYKGTYGLHMTRWCVGLSHDIEIQYFKLVGCDNLLVQAIEDSLWMKLRPAFGRKGDK